MYLSVQLTELLKRR